MALKKTGKFHGKSNKLGGGGRFAQVAAKAGGGAKGAAIAAAAGRAKYGNKKMTAMATAGKKRKAKKSKEPSRAAVEKSVQRSKGY